jgi:two-component system, NtrC family, response regulator AtoC
LNILLADDDKNFGLILKSELEEDHHCVDLVANGVDAVLSFINNLHDFVLLDLRMPKLGGMDALRIIKNINPKVPAIAFSGNAGSDERAEILRCGAIKCFSKPFAVAQLKEDIKKCFEELSLSIAQ